ncbi:MAG: hypothetical protein QM214_04775 [Bacillota bacterium]|jgi:hypothetical protein|nr:hypothetical protein [Bacillota bacterium]HHU43671.1 hypothetical protein [Clostridiales bacterium]
MQELLTAIKKDDLATFKRITDKKRGLMSLSFGRFPVLSLCYLYKSKKIIKSFENQLFSITNYNIVEEDFQSYKLFRKLSGRCLRFFIDRIVTPYDMLAVLGESLHIIEKSKRFPLDEDTFSRVESIFNMLHFQKVKITDNRIEISKKRFLGYQKAYILITILAVLFVSLLSGGAWYGYKKAFGDGSANNPLRIAGEAQLIQAMSSKRTNFYLAKDIVLTKEWTAKNFSGRIDGKGHAIYSYGYIKSSFIDELDGRVENLKIHAEYSDKEILENTALFVKNNNGEIKNVSVKISASFIRGEGDDALYFSCLAYQNDGDILNSKIDGDITFQNNIGKDMYLSGIASINNGRIDGCQTSSKFVCDTVDVSGIAIENNKTIKKSVNRADISQTTSTENWFPHAGGICMNNYGTIEECENYGDIKVEAYAEEKIYEATGAGIACINTGTIKKSKNNSKIIGISKRAHMYIGGIVAQNTNSHSAINNCASYGNISISSENDNEIFLFGGGIVGYFIEGQLKDCYSLTKIESTYPQSRIGGIIGMIFGNPIMSLPENCFFLSRENISYGIGSVLGQFNVVYEGSVLQELGIKTGIEAVGSLDELKQKGVYWG